MSSVNHRCEESLKAKVSIRYSKRYHNIKDENDYATWRLFKADYSDYDLNNIILRYICTISHCPFCGEKLAKD